MQKDVHNLSAAELDNRIEELKNKVNGEIERHTALLKQLQMVQNRRKEIKAEHDKHEIEKIQKQILSL
ncbi:MAG: hypothetical protein ACD_43C00253G0002 [uncultured bacterium]|nr:MAG: hypothetical protein ACD_43C00253G0002 [uncultured bacterium]